MKYTKVVEAVDVRRSNFEQLKEFCGESKICIWTDSRSPFNDITRVITFCLVATLSGMAIARPGDYIVKNDEAGLTVYTREKFKEIYKIELE